MIIGRVAGQIFMTVNHQAYDARTLLIIDRLTPEGEPAGGYLIAIDTVGAGAGQTVLVNDEGGGAQQVLGCPGAPIRTVVVGIIDEVS
ncbi:MAG: EutN/CcmL family microcompartment protein [Acidobacteriota bacterium]